MQNKRILTRVSCIIFSLSVFYLSGQWIINTKAKEFKHNNNIITTAYNNNIIDSVKFSNNSYRLFLNDEDIKNIKFDKSDLSDENIKLLNRMSFQDIPSATKEFILASLDTLVDYNYIGNNLYYFKINNDIRSTDSEPVEHSNEMEFKVYSDFSNSELKIIKKEIKKNQKRYYK